MAAGMLVGDRTDPRSALPRVAFGAMALPLLVSLTGAVVVLLPATVGTALLLRATPEILRDTERQRDQVFSWAHG